MKDSGLSWIGMIPSNWRCLRGKYALQYLQKQTKEDDGVITCFRDGEVTLRSNRREEGFTISEKEIGYQGIDIGDLVVHGMDGFAGAIGISDSRGKASPVLVVLDSDENKRFLMYYLRNLAYRDVFLALATGIRVRSCDLRWNKIADTVFVLPPIEEQNAIVTYIDEKLSEIDAAIKEAQELIEKYKAYKQSVITEAVTKGLDPQVSMKDSGVKWIGKIPEHWNILSSRYWITRRDAGSWGSDPVGNEQDAICIRIADFDYGHLCIKKECEYTVRNYSKEALKHLFLKRGDIIMEKSGGGDKFPVGRAVLYDLDFPALFANFSERIRVDKKYSNKYMLYAFAAHYSMGLSRLYFNQTTGLQNLIMSKFLREVKLPLPPLAEQNKIADYLDDKCAKIDSIIAVKENLITRLQEYKKSIIFEYVTGKKEVPNG